MADWKHCSKRKEKKMNHHLGLPPVGSCAHIITAHSLSRLCFTVMGLSQQLAHNHRINSLPPSIHIYTDQSLLFVCCTLYAFFFLLLSHPLMDKTVSHTLCHV